MRVISGTARGLKLASLDGDATRPTLDNVKEAIFSMLFDKVRDARVLDLFAGSGALGIEALSRGASSCVFVDKNAKAVKVIEDNLSKSRTKEKAHVLCTDSFDALSRLDKDGREFDIIFLDPPYAEGLLDKALSDISSLSLLSEGGIIVAESDKGTPLDIQNYKLTKDKDYGRVCIRFLEAL